MWGLRVAMVVLAIGCCGRAAAVPSFARQTGFDCTTCHLSWPELTRVGRQFKLGGYTLTRATASEPRPLVSFNAADAPPLVPLAAFAQVSLTHSIQPATPGADASQFPAQNRGTVQQVSVLLAGRWAEHLGSFAQWSYDGLAHHSSIDNLDLRLAGRSQFIGAELSYGLSLNNNPGVTDLYNTTPVWGFPFVSSSVAATPAAAPLLQGGLAQQVAGLTGYAMWRNAWYAEVGGYRTADKMFSLLRAGIDRSQAAVLNGTAPYWRVAWQHEDDASVMVGAYGLSARKYPDPLAAAGLSDRYRDIGVDAQWQWLGDAHRLSTQWSYLRETQDLAGSAALGMASSAAHRLHSLNAKLTYYYRSKYGASVALQRTHGDADNALYNTGEAVSGSANGNPGSDAVVVEFDWLPWRDRRICLQYTAYQRFNGATSNYDGRGRNASDNNNWFLVAWWAF